jgi:uncharacterized protein (UPF0548 family)
LSTSQTTITEIEVQIGLRSGGEQCITYQPARDTFTEDDRQLIVRVEHSETWTELLHVAADNISFIRQQIREVQVLDGDQRMALAIN